VYFVSPPHKGLRERFPLLLALVLWLCTLPLLGLLVLPLLGSGPTLTVAVTLLALYTLICFVLCRPPGRSAQPR
jgi:hypothetical protein